MANAALNDAVDEGDIDKCRRLVEEDGADVNDKDEDGNSPIILACSKGHLDVVELLESKGANIHYKNNKGFSCFILACLLGHLDIIKFLMSKGETIHDIVVFNNIDFSCLMVACFKGHLNVADFLVSEGASINVNCLALAINQGHLDIVDFLVSQVENLINDKDNDGESCLMVACASGHVDITDFLMSKGASIHEVYNTCFSYACNRNFIRVLYRLRKWPTTMAILVLQELALIYIIDSESVIDLHQYLGRPEDLKIDNEEDYPKDEDGNVVDKP